MNVRIKQNKNGGFHVSSINKFKLADINKKNNHFSNFKVMIETAFYGNHVTTIGSINKAYQLAVHSPGTIVTDIPIYNPEDFGISCDAKVLVENNGAIVGRTTSARRIINTNTAGDPIFSAILREALFSATKTPYYRSQIIVGLDKKFMIKGNLMVPEGYELLLYSYLLNFQILNEQFSSLYNQSKNYDETDIFIFSDPDWSHPDFPNGLALFDPDHNVAAILGLRYFGELKKATLTLAWRIANRNGFVACHGGIKQFKTPQDTLYTMAAFGLSGSGKSTITLANHNNKYPIKVLHDDAFIISQTDGSSIALEPSYFDKTQDYQMDSEDIKYFLTAQNVGVTRDIDNRKVLVTEDIRNGNGRTVKSHFATPNRVNHISEKIDAIFWIMKDDSLPPIIKIDDPITATVFGATLATKRSTAENINPDIDLNALVIEPFANPFRVYPLKEDYFSFKDLFENQQVSCYILNTSFFNDKKISPQITLSVIESLVDNSSSFKPFGPLSDISYLEIDNLNPNFNDKDYVLLLKKRVENRLKFVKESTEIDKCFNSLPEEAALKLQELINQLEKHLESRKNEPV